MLILQDTLAQTCIKSQIDCYMTVSVPLTPQLIDNEFLEPASKLVIAIPGS